VLDETIDTATSDPLKSVAAAQDAAVLAAMTPFAVRLVPLVLRGTGISPVGNRHLRSATDLFRDHSTGFVEDGA
jgi:hypothetical protein